MGKMTGAPLAAWYIFQSWESSQNGPTNHSICIYVYIYSILCSHIIYIYIYITYNTEFQKKNILFDANMFEKTMQKDTSWTPGASKRT